MNGAPKTIYLHYDQEESTWCDERIGDNDIEYVQAAELATLQARLATACHIEAGDSVGFDFMVLDQLGELEQARKDANRLAMIARRFAVENPLWQRVDLPGSPQQDPHGVHAALAAHDALTPPEQVE